MVTNGQRYREKVSQMVGWGHWFALFNIILGLLIGSRYLFVIDWPGSLMGRIYAIVSWLGHFGFIGFAAYLLVLFPLTFIVMSQRLLRFIAAAYATAGLTLLLLDTEVFNRFNLHINKFVWEMLVNPSQGELSRDWQLLFIFVPILFLIEMLFGTWCWQKLRSLSRRSFAKPIVIALICAFVSSHLIYIWADANFYRSITMQKANLPLAHPMTARRFLERHGIIDGIEYQRRLDQQGNIEAPSVEYPLNKIAVKDAGSGYNLLMVVVDGIRTKDVAEDMPRFSQLTQESIQFTQHISSGNRDDTGLFGLFYGISPTYMDGIIAGRKPSALMSALNQQGYQLGLFSTDGFNNTLYQQSLFTDFSLPVPFKQSNEKTTEQWKQWLTTRSKNTPWFAYVNYKGMPQNTDSAHAENFIARYRSNAKEIDNQIASILETLKANGQLDNTVVVVTAEHGVEYNDSKQNAWGAGQNYSRSQLQVPLTILWPGTPKQKINKLTGHEDVMLTLMQRLLHVTNPSNEYSQGEDLFNAERRNNWLALGDSKQLIIVTPTQTLRLDGRGRYDSYDLDYQKQNEEKPQLALLLQVLTELKRFLAD